MFGGELSGHYYFASCFNTDSGLMAMIKIYELALQLGQAAVAAYRAVASLPRDGRD